MSGAVRTALCICAGAVMMMAAKVHAAPAGEPPAWCPALRDVAALVRARDRFASIIGRPREGNYFETTLPLPGWGDCAFYGRRTYVCDSRPLAAAEDSADAFAKTVADVKGCLGDAWAEDPDNASPGYAVLRDSRQVASITINTDRTDKDENVVRLILFLRGGR